MISKRIIQALLLLLNVYFSLFSFSLAPESENNKISYIEKKLLKDKINAGIVKRERLLSKEQITVVFDLDETIAVSDMNSQGDIFYVIRTGMEDVFRDLKKLNIRLVLWTLSPAENILKYLLPRNPDFLNDFDLIITGENFSVPLAILQKNNLIEAYQATGIDISFETIEAFYDRNYGVKDLSLFGYHLIVEDRPLKELVDQRAKSPLGKDLYNICHVEKFAPGDDDSEDIKALTLKILRMVNRCPFLEEVWQSEHIKLSA